MRGKTTSKSALKRPVSRQSGRSSYSNGSWACVAMSFILLASFAVFFSSYSLEPLISLTHIDRLPFLRRTPAVRIDNAVHSSPGISSRGSDVYNTSKYTQEILASIAMLKQHPLHRPEAKHLQSKPLDVVMKYVFKQSTCEGRPLFTTMANVMSELYWQMIENFMYTLAKYNHSSCALMICVSDDNCMKKCQESSFPCYHYDHRLVHPDSAMMPSALEQIAELKLLHLPKALEKGVDTFIVDLDVGFLGDPMLLLIQYMSHQHIDIFVQEDVTFIMDRSEALWKTWYTSKMPNIGLMLCRGNKRTVKVFELAWADYQNTNPSIRSNPGKDQNKVVNAMNQGKKEFKLKWKFFPKTVAVLLDKIFKFQEQTYELGGQAAYETLDPDIVVAAHTTCYEQKVKVMGLKAVNAFWNPQYYDPNRRTITKKLIYTGPATHDLINEIRSLMYLAVVSKRALILPNILGDDRAVQDAIELYRGQAIWPGFRVLFLKEDHMEYKVNILEPGYYWRIRTTTSYGEMIPEPTVICIPKANTLLGAIENLILSTAYHSASRLILHMSDNCNEFNGKKLISWADDSVGRFDSYIDEIKDLQFLPSLKESMDGTREEVAFSPLSDIKLGRNILDTTRLCEKIFERARGNRSCFDKCD